MKFIYPAVFRQREDGKFTAFFPDLECCTATGDTLEDAVERANEAANDWISLELSEEDPQLPPVSEPSDLSLSEGDIVRNIAVNIRFYEGWDE
ncbi:MAG: type II toxin-antitoxin system HicB family antitoxin [Eubacteriales bacterium]|nr:type II toxin-antitoxin system HicB family antitoxin [Eubacteriales bacterium]